MDIVVVGAGVMGLTCAVRLVEAGHSVRVCAADPPGRTTSAVAGAMCGPRIPTGDSRLDRWAQVCDEKFTALSHEADAGIALVRGRLVSRMAPGIPVWARDLPGFRACTSDEAMDFASAFWVDVPIADMPAYLDHLLRQLSTEGIWVEKTRFASLDEAATLAPVVVNCSGIGARQLVPDPGVRAVRGQHVVVTNPGLDSFFFEWSMTGSWTSWFPQGDQVLLGGVATDDDWSLADDDEVSAGIRGRCEALEPRLRGAGQIRVDVGLRPVRDTPRVEREQRGRLTVIHNYGHGGSGVSQSWGAAEDVLALLGVGRGRAS
ncbi:FAD-dependent oxidoreductase [Mariniluteicoccus flavus]